MGDHRASNSRKIAAGIMGIMMLFIVMLSAFYIAAEAGHDCIGEDCPICASLLQCENTLHRISDGAVTLTVAAVPTVIFLLSLFISVFELPQETPVSRKIRLNN